MTGGVGHDELKRFYKYHFIGVNPPDFSLTSISRLIYTPEIEREFGSPDWKRASTLGVLGALTYRIMPKVALGAELEYYRAHEGLGLNTSAGDGLYVGPTFHMQVTNKFILSAAFSTQIAGHAAGNANFLDLTNFSRNKALLRAVLEF